MTPRQLEILQHALGADQYGQGGGTRNYFAAGPGDEPDCRELVAMGYMRQYQINDISPDFNCSVTDTGKAAMRAESPRPPKMTRGQQRYREFLRADTGESFSQWLKDRRGRQAMSTDHEDPDVLPAITPWPNAMRRR